ncbi:MAG: DUF943 family protein [Serratia rubidaea]|nr:DUF943 family protein [Serratia rubidaea]
MPCIYFYILWCYFQPVELIAVHQRNNFSDELVNNLRLLIKEVIKW